MKTTQPAINMHTNLRNHLALLVNITLNCHVVGFDIGCHEAIMNIFRDLDYRGTNLICH